MTNSPQIKSEMARLALRYISPMIRTTLLADSLFREEYNFRSDFTVSFNDFGVAFHSAKLLEAVRKTLSDSSSNEVLDESDQRWILKIVSGETELPKLGLFCNDQNVGLPADFVILSPHVNQRLRFLDEIAFDVNLSHEVRGFWHDILVKRSLEDDEIEEFDSDIRNTPVSIARSIHSTIEKGHQINAQSLVPSSRTYFERLIGVYDGSTSIRDYAANVGRNFFAHLSLWQPYDGFLFSLLLSSHFLLTTEINIDDLENNDLVNAYDFLDKHGDRISQLGAIEVGLRVLERRPEIRPMLINLIDQIYGDDVDEKLSGMRLLSALFIFVDGELSRTKLLSATPPFYRRLAALSQAAFLHRQLINSSINVDGFCAWLLSNGSGPFYMQSLVDLRLEPRWIPDYAVAAQMKADFIGRLMIAVKSPALDLKDSDLSEFILRKTSENFPESINYLRLYFPGPLEGIEESKNALPVEFAEIIQAQLDMEKVGASSFIALVNSALIFHIDTEFVELAARAVKIGNYRLANVEDRSQLLAILNGLAQVAAVTRSKTLAAELRILARRYRYDSKYALSVEEVFRLCLIAAANDPDLNAWRDFVGDWLTELAFSDLKDDDGDVFYSHLQYLFHIVPELWVSCGRADAALQAYNSI